jgi:hypothetical protein
MKFFFFHDETLSFFMMEFWLSRSLSHEPSSFSRWIFGYQEAFLTNLFLFSRWNSGYQEAFLTNFSFTWWNLGYHGAFSRFFLSHGGISAIKEPFHEFFFHMVESRQSQSLFMIFSFTCWNLSYHGAFSRIFLSHGASRLSHSLFTNVSFTWWNLGYHGAFSRIFLSHGGILAITEPFHDFFFHMVEFLKKHDVGEDSFHIYHKEYLHRIRIIKNLAS